MPTRASDRVTLAVLPAPSYVRVYYQLAASTASAPAVPTTNPPPAAWSTTEPTYTAGSTSTLYTVMLVAYGSVAFEYGPVQKSSAYEAAKQAYNLATQANGLPRLERGTAAPTASSPAAPDGSAYFRHQVVSGEPVGSGPVIATYARVSGAWVETPIIVRAGQIEGGVVIGLLLQTAASGQRTEIKSNVVQFFDSQNRDAGSMFGEPGQLDGQPVITVGGTQLGTQILGDFSYGLVVDDGIRALGHIQGFTAQFGSIVASTIYEPSTLRTLVGRSGKITPPLAGGYNMTDGPGSLTYESLNGVVYISGRVSRTAGNSTIFTLPAGYRPGPGTHVWGCVGASATPRRIRVLDDGQVQVLDGGTFDGLSLSSISFAIA